MTAHFETLPADARGVWLILSENGTKVFFDIDDERLFHRIPAEHGDGTMTRFHSDGRWTRLLLGPRGPEEGTPVSVGSRCFYSLGFSDGRWTSHVAEIRPATDDEAPPPNPVVVRWSGAEWSCGTGWDLAISGEGDTSDEAIASLVVQVDEWLDDLWRRREVATRTARVWASRSDRSGSVGAWVRANALLDEDSMRP